MTAAPLHRRGAEVVRALHALTEPASSVEPDPPTASRAFRELSRALETWQRGRGEAFRIRLRSGEFFVNRRLLRLDAWTWERARELADRMNALQIGALRFDEQTSAADLQAFAEDLIATSRDGEVFAPCCYGGLEILPLQTPSSQDPRGRAVALYHDLVQICSELDQDPSRRSLRRILQFLVDEIAERAPLYQQLAAAGLDEPAPDAQAAARAAIEAMAFAIWLGLGRPEVLGLGLAAVIERRIDPALSTADAVAVALSLEGLGEHGERVVIAVHDARDARLDRPAGAAGRLLRAVERSLETPYLDELRGVVDAELLALLAERQGAEPPPPALTPPTASPPKAKPAPLPPLPPTDPIRPSPAPAPIDLLDDEPPTEEDTDDEPTEELPPLWEHPPDEETIGEGDAFENPLEE